jgi:hypothetical protein
MMNAALASMNEAISPLRPTKRLAGDEGAAPPVRPRGGFDPTEEAQILGMLNSAMTEKETRLQQMIATTIQTQLAPICAFMPVITEKVEAVQERLATFEGDMKGQVTKIEERIAKLEEKPPTPASIRGDSGSHACAPGCDENGEDIGKIAKVLQLRLGVVIPNTKSAGAEAVTAIFAQFEKSLADLGASVEQVYKPKHAAGSYVNVAFDDGDDRKTAKWSMSTSEDGNWRDMCSYKGSPVRAFYPKPKFEAARDKRLFDAMRMFAAQERMSRDEFKVDLESRTIIKEADGSVVARQSLETWRVAFARD